MKRREFLATGGALLLAGCATTPLGSFNAQEVPAPQWRAGDSWTFRRTDGYNGVPRGVLTRSVEAAEQGRIRVVTRNESGAVLDDALFEAPGIELAGVISEYGPGRTAFSPALRMYDFPLVSGKTWRQSLARTDATGFRSYLDVTMGVEGWQDVPLTGKTVQALVVRRNFMVSATSPFYGVLNREEIEWYAPELRGAARLHVNEYIASPRRMHWFPGDRFRYALETFRLA